MVRFLGCFDEWVKKLDFAGRSEDRLFLHDSLQKVRGSDSACVPDDFADESQWVLLQVGFDIWVAFIVAHDAQAVA